LDKEKEQLTRDLEYWKKREEEENERERMYNDALEKYADFIRPGELPEN
jgi:hypothetical protein